MSAFSQRLVANYDADTTEAGVEKRARAHPAVGEGTETESDQLDIGGITKEDIGEELQRPICARAGGGPGRDEWGVCKEGCCAQARPGEPCECFSQGVGSMLMLHLETHFRRRRCRRIGRIDRRRGIAILVCPAQLTVLDVSERAVRAGRLACPVLQRRDPIEIVDASVVQLGNVLPAPCGRLPGLDV